MYINVCMQQGPVFNTVPTESAYSGIWSVVFMQFLPGKCRRVCNTAPYDQLANPYGFPITSGINKEADLLSAYGTSQTGVVVDCPIVAVGAFPTSGPWFPGSNANSNPLSFYRLRQVLAYNAYNKTVTLPAWYVYCQNFITKYINKCTVIIPDVQDATLATRLKANLAPGLGNFDANNTQDFKFIDGRIYHDGPSATWFKNGGPAGIWADVNQYPVIEQCPTGHGAQNINRCYSPVMEFDILELTSAPNPYCTDVCFVNNADYADYLEGAGFLTEVKVKKINAPVIDCYKIVSPGGSCCFPK